MPINKEENLSRQLKQAKGQDPDKPEEEIKPDIIRQPHPERKKMIVWVAVLAVIIGIIGAVGLGLRMKYKNTTTFSDKFNELKGGFEETWSGFSDGLPGKEEVQDEEQTKKRILSNPNNLSEEEIEELEKKAFPENPSTNSGS